jgi:Arc/MetJ-type ribon-helix-helix transcriptional regulator
MAESPLASDSKTANLIAWLRDWKDGPPSLQKRPNSCIKSFHFDGFPPLQPPRGKESNMEKEMKNVSIPASLYKQIEEAVRAGASVAEFVAKALREALEKKDASGDVFSAEDEEKVKERLKALGYID